MEENKYICPKCCAEMIAVYKKPALNLACPKCDCKLATTIWEDIDLDDTDYEIVLKLSANPSMNQIKFLSHLTGQNYIASKKLLEKGGVLLKAKAVEVKNKMVELDKINIQYYISPDFPY
jgi:hypothetical protein